YRPENLKFQGRYTREVSDYELLIPEKVDYRGKFISFTLPHFYKRSNSTRQKRNSKRYSEKVHYKLRFYGKDHHLEMWPNPGFISPGGVVEERGSGSATNVSKIKIRPIKRSLCHYKGKVKGHQNSRLALSTCEGLTGYVRTDHGHYFIEPVRNHNPRTDGQHLHMIYRKTHTPSEETCGTKNWKEGWRDRIRHEYGRRQGTMTNLKTDDETNLSKLFRRTATSKHNYLEILVVADKHFLDYHNNTDYETYILTIMNMASDYFHDQSTGNLIDFVVVRIIYLFKEEEEIDLIINQDAESTLRSFCKWQASVNPPAFSHPNHHDIAILLTRYDLCSDNMSRCGLLGLAYVAQACNANMSCAINEDSGLVLGVVVTHEVGHIMGCGHDNPNDTGCKSNADEFNSHVMSPYVQLATANWSTCSKKFMQEFLEYDLGDCLLDEPQDHNFKTIDMPPGAMYDATFQCRQIFNNPNAEFCDQGPEKNCESLYCKYTSSFCATNKQPPADGTRCGNNMWCYNGNCVPIGERPQAINGEWGDWMAWSECSRTCGGGVTFTERDCNNPTPQHHGRYCLGERRRYRVCNMMPCDPEDLTFREKQCSEYNKNGEHWKPFTMNQPDDVCKLYCENDKNIIKIMAQRVKDGTPCKPGTRNLCIAGKCRVVGCDWIIDSDVVEDQCGVCRGDGTQCTIVDKTFRKIGIGYVKITAIPKGSTKIIVEELKPSPNTLALAAANESTFLLNGDYTEENDEEFHIVGTVGYYFHPEEDLEQIVISGPTTEDLVLFACFFTDANPGILYRYAIRTGNESSSYLPKYHWEFLEWNECDKRCGIGTQVAKPRCIEEKGGKVSDAFCTQSMKPEPKVRICNEQPCRAFWKVGEWTKCNGCLFKSGQRMRTVQCVKESPYEDEYIITEDSNCGQNKPKRLELCNSARPCNRRVRKSSIRKSNLFSDKQFHGKAMKSYKYNKVTNHSSEETARKIKEHSESVNEHSIPIRNPNREKMSKHKYIKKKAMHRLRSESKFHDNNNGIIANKQKCSQRKMVLNKKQNPSQSNQICPNKEESYNDGSCEVHLHGPKPGAIIKDVAPQKQFDIVEIPILENKNDIVLSDEASEELGDKLSEVLDTKEKKEFTGEEATKHLHGLDKKEPKKEKESNFVINEI
ncbi:hypothetical protein L9F63_003040, partial [Diploptera punctata]